MCIRDSNDTSGQVSYANSRICRVNRLTAVSTGPESINLEVVLFNLDIFLLGFRHDSNSSGGSVDSSLALCHRYSLHTMHTRLIFELSISFITSDVKDNFLKSACF